jgi:hypothetical protein
VLEVEKIELVKAMTGETNENTVSAYLGMAGNKICRKAFPFDPTVADVPEQYEFTQVEIAVYLLNKRGAEGETAHSENGISRSYEDGDVPPTLLRQIVPMAGVL